MRAESMPTKEESGCSLTEHRINYGRLLPYKRYFKADCSCGWGIEGDRQAVIAAVRKHEDLI